jgi:Uncharacterized conserved protein
MSTHVEPVAARTLAAAAIGFRLHRHPAARNQSELHLTGLDVATSAKTLAFRLADGAVVLAAIPGLGRLRYPNLAKALGVSRSALRPADPDALADLEMLPGGVSPICADPSVRLVVDAQLLGLDVIYCGSGIPEASIELSPAALAELRPDLVVAELCE